MATVNNWIDHLTAASKAEGGAAGPIFPGAGSEGILVIILVIIWIGWTVISSRQESEKLEKLARKRHGPNDWKSNVTDG